MTGDKYVKIIEYFEDHPFLRQVVIFLNAAITASIYLIYCASLVYLFYNKDRRIIPVFLIPAILFVLVSLIRKSINTPRPYTTYNYTPLINKESIGESTPSRHVFSAFVISVVLSFINPIFMIMVILSVLLAILRVIVGVHFIKDVVWGALIGIAGGLIGMLLWSLINPMF